MRAEIKSWYVEESEDLSTYEIDAPACFGYSLTFAVGPVNENGEDYFEVFVASASYLAQRDSTQSPAFLRHIILAPDYNIPAAVALVEKYLSSLKENTWVELATKINRVIHWEFEDYKIAE